MYIILYKKMSTYKSFLKILEKLEEIFINYKNLIFKLITGKKISKDLRQVTESNKFITCLEVHGYIYPDVECCNVNTFLKKINDNYGLFDVISSNLTDVRKFFAILSEIDKLNCECTPNPTRLLTKEINDLITKKEKDVKINTIECDYKTKYFELKEQYDKILTENSYLKRKFADIE